MDPEERDRAVRLAAFEFLGRQTGLHGEILSRRLLADGFVFDGQRVPLVGPQGIFKPKVIPTGVPLSITSVAEVEGQSRPYEDAVNEDGQLLYRYRGTDPNHHENVGLRRAMADQIPLIFFQGVEPGSYHPEWPIYVVGDNPDSLTFTAVFDDPEVIRPDLRGVPGADDARRRYVTRLAVARLHQVAFRRRVLTAYRETCAVCRLRQVSLIDAAHILPDGHPRGEPVVPNGLALCKIHHAAYDHNILGIRPDLVVEIRQDILDTIDGPMLRHGLQGMHGEGLTVLPRRRDQRPSPDRLAERYDAFRSAS
ncbi:MAG: HNH endonuclease [Acidimicrobiales bacterium]